MKFYIPLPHGMEFKKIDKEDHLVNTADESQKINVQNLIKEFLRNPKKSKTIPIPTLQVPISTTLPSDLSLTYIVYEPNNNGAQASSKFEILNVKAHGTYSPERNPALFFGNYPWITHSPLSADKRALIEEKRHERRENLRHTGDNPKPT